MKIYTRTGDDGTTGLIGGVRVPKSDPRIDCYGTVDELNAAIGLAAVESDEPFLSELRQVQAELFVIGSHLATPEQSRHKAALPVLGDAMVSRLESQIDAAEAQLPPLRNFILPGGSELASRLHLARTVCRRAERLLVSYGAGHGIPPLTITYLNRLSDWLFVQARAANQRENVQDIPWITTKGS
ncbi:MAG TPA: cob(I)yrinic acid a,c-diamide adenosyltransferase [Tepidisphaeraceae bacterium]|nr:cob(I)yrinic acid a,c-diamide adenosyltransferase [Tepidisphaeraceae bacterium]